MKRRDLVASLGAAALASACSPGESRGGSTAGRQRYSWKMVTTWPPNFPGVGVGVNTLARYITEMSGGRLDVRVYAAGELVPPFEVFDAVSQGAAELGHGSAYYWRGKTEASQFFTTIPFGLNAHEMSGWLYYGGGLELWQEVYAPFNLVPFPGGNTGVQMGGWFRRPIESMADLHGLKMRMPGMAGEVLKRAGAVSVNLPGSEIFTALQTGSIDATEWVGPYNDVAFGLHQIARYYYYPGWQEPGPSLECIVNRAAWESLPEDLQAIVRIACQAAALDIQSDYMARNASALAQLEAEGQVEIRAFPDSVLEGLRLITSEYVAELAAGNPMVAKVWASYRDFLRRSRPWQEISELAILTAPSI